MGTRERHIGHAAARTAPAADPRGGRLFAMPRFFVGITHQVYRHRVFAIAGAITALFLMLLAVLPALFAFDPKLSNAVPAYSEVSEEVVDALAHSSSLPLLVAAIIFSIWGVSVYLRCLDYVLRRRLVAVATICALWMIEVILKYKSFTPFYATVLWYLYYVPVTLIPLLYQLCGLRLAGLEQHRLGRRYCAALWIVAILLIGFVLTNDFHQQVFHFDRTSDTWSNDYTYGWGYFAPPNRNYFTATAGGIDCGGGRGNGSGRDVGSCGSGNGSWQGVFRLLATAARRGGQCSGALPAG